jgi:hypothetical protein
MNGKFLILQESEDGAPWNDLIAGGYACEWEARKVCNQANRIAKGFAEYYVFGMDGKRGQHPPMDLNQLKAMIRPMRQMTSGKAKVSIQCGEIACFRFE